MRGEKGSKCHCKGKKGKGGTNGGHTKGERNPAGKEKSTGDKIRRKKGRADNRKGDHHPQKERSTVSQEIRRDGG